MDSPFDSPSDRIAALTNLGVSSRHLFETWRQDLFFGDPDVLYISTHQDGAFPGTGKVYEIGEAGTTVNVPLPPGSGDQAAAMAFDTIVEPVSEEAPPLLRFLFWLPP